MQSVLLFLLLIIPVNRSHSQTFINLTSSLHTEYAYLEQPIMFRCVVINSPILAWSSPNYIGENGIQLEFLSVSEPGAHMTSAVDPNTVAMLNSVTTGEETVIESTLRVVASSRFRISSVACHNVGQGTENSTTFEVLGEEHKLYLCLKKCG